MPASSSSGLTPFSTMFGVPHSLVMQRVVAEVPPEVVGQILRPAVGLPGAFDVERLVVEHEDAAGPSPFGAPSALM